MRNMRIRRPNLNDVDFETPPGHLILNMSQNTKESTGVLLNRMAPEIVQVAKQRLEAARNDVPSGKLT